MHVPSTKIAPALKALVENLIDYAGMFPPAGLTLQETTSRYASYQEGDYAWMLNRLVVQPKDLDKLPESLNGRLALLAESDEKRAGAIESKSVIKAEHPVYCEVALDNLSELVRVKESGCFAKIRTGGVKPEAIPSPGEVAAFILKCAELKLPFKATAGLHHPIRAEQPLTYDQNAPRAVMHGFINVLMASAFALHGEKDIEPILSETDINAFSFDEKAHWAGKSLTAEQVRDARKNFMHSIGSCSFDEPVNELQALGLL